MSVPEEVCGIYFTVKCVPGYKHLENPWPRWTNDTNKFLFVEGNVSAFRYTVKFVDSKSHCVLNRILKSIRNVHTP